MNSDVTLKVLETALIRQDHGGMCKVPAETVEKCVEIVKAQKPIKPYAMYSEHMGTKWLVCGACEQPMIKITPGAEYPYYCPVCGRKVEWE